MADSWEHPTIGTTGKWVSVEPNYRAFQLTAEQRQALIKSASTLFNPRVPFPSICGFHWPSSVQIPTADEEA